MKYGKNLSHAYLICGQAQQAYEEVGRLAAAMLCTSPGERPCGLCRSCVKAEKGIHPDIITVSRLTDDKGKERREIYVDQIREITESALILPNESEKKVYIVRDAGTMNPSAQNAFLKLLEEPPPFVAFILTADNAGQLLETVRSRCVIINLKTGEREFTPEIRQLSEKYVRCAAAGSASKLLSFLNANSEMTTAEADDFVQCSISVLTDMLCGRLPDMGLERRKLMELIGLMERAGEYLRFNVSVKHVFGVLSADTIDLK